MKNFLCICSALCLLSFNHQTLAQARGEIPAYAHFGDKKTASIDDFITQYQTAWRELDASSFAKMHSKDTEWTNAFARIFRGREALEIFVKERLFPQFAQMQSNIDTLDLHAISSRILSDSAAVLHLYTDLGTPTDQSVRRVHFHLVLANNGGEWEIVHTAIMDPRQ
ncbi:YybH family protein [Arenicella xantha]|uniref:Uncharacterized protein (TIGR02246 family) n=1 Tax=Arenicella xantha TaxID=644221 RepID=A0A395JM92_9GAMM|nr:nuclear transport factor 2 family protein [Arenicella xantha]RBP51729.1 uncharacterized protein (TIGR02246 family) [Arenicella xantha]